MAPKVDRGLGAYGTRILGLGEFVVLNLNASNPGRMHISCDFPSRPSNSDSFPKLEIPDAPISNHWIVSARDAMEYECAMEPSA